jgi:hypothetical protein
MGAQPLREFEATDRSRHLDVAEHDVHCNLEMLKDDECFVRIRGLDNL